MSVKKSPWKHWRSKREVNRQAILDYIHAKKKRRTNPMKEKRRIKVELYKHTKEEPIPTEVEYEGRLLGLIDDKQFSSLLKHKELQGKFLTMETMALTEITAHYKEMHGLRLAIAIKKRNGEWANNNLFISEKLKQCAFTTEHTKGLLAGQLQAGFSGEDNGWILMTEKVV